MTSIPFDPTLTLGNVVNKTKITQLMEIAELQKPVIAAKDKLNNLIRMNYSIKMVKQELENLMVPFDKMTELNETILKLKESTITAASDYAKAAIKGEDDVAKAKDRHGQTQISMSAESPLDFGQSEITSFPLSFDTLKFDVQYVRNEEQIDSSEAYNSQVQKSAAASMSMFGVTASASTSSSTASTGLTQSSFHTVEGTIVITAYATHKNATVISPCVLDPRKAVASWNQMFPKDTVRTDPVGIFEDATDAHKKGKKVEEVSHMDLLSGCSKASSFVGFVHLKKTEQTSSSQTSESKTKAMQAAIEADLWVASISGSFGTSSSSASQSKSLTSTSMIQNHAVLVCEGMIPNIAANEISTTVMKLNPDPSETMAGLQAIQGATQSGVNDSMEAASGEAKTGAQYQAMSADYVGSAVSALNEVATDNIQVIDTNSMMTAFTDFVTTCQGGDCGVPINFWIKRLTKADVAKCYIRKFYPNGATNAKDARAGQLGMEPTEGGDDDNK